ncbi:unnamed protein product [Adineta steineri]|uniref:G-protein coupled receptors family 1 profile domain-containing protein n=2 Tax=Adineta steineri TaxID=433720 RepID=A0A819K9N7_9BILA|nr:unnamed protein product [Adineta steineri]CAF3940765.1 unnamed protein product [Adineta steineri]
MENEMNLTNSQEVLRTTTCQQIAALIKDMHPSTYESRNMTREAFILLIHPPNCIPQQYLGVQGVQKWFFIILLAFFLIFGLFGNILSAIIMFRRSRRGLSSYLYLGLLAITDICVLYSGCLLYFLGLAFQYKPQLNGTISCRLNFYFKHLFTYISAWLIVAVTFERFIVVRFPIQSIRICRLRIAYTVTLTIIIFFSIYTAHGFFTMGVLSPLLQTDKYYDPDYRVCDLIDNEKHRHILPLIDLCFYSVIPSIFIFIFNISIIITIFHALKQRRTYLQANSYLPTTDTYTRTFNQKTKSSSSTRTQFFRSRSAESSPAGRSFIQQGRIYHNGLNKNNFQQKSQQVLFDSTSATGIRLTCLLLLISFISVLCTLPPSIRAFTADLRTPQESTVKWQIAELVTTTLMYFNHTINFVLYCLTGRVFRNECRKLLRGLWALKDIQISCTMSSDSDKHHHYRQQIILSDRNRITTSQQQRMKRSNL